MPAARDAVEGLLLLQLIHKIVKKYLLFVYH